MKFVTLVLLLPVTTALKAADFFLINETPPDSFKYISSSQQLPPNEQFYKTPLGVTSRCFEGKYFLILSENELGNGYEFTQHAPEKVNCTLLNDKIKPIQNQTGIYLGFEKNKIMEILKIPQSTDAATLLYNREILKGNKKYDEQTWIDVEFTDNRLTLLKVFTSLTE